jgi:hypothetical protein
LPNFQKKNQIDLHWMDVRASPGSSQRGAWIRAHDLSFPSLMSVPAGILFHVVGCPSALSRNLTRKLKVKEYVCKTSPHAGLLLGPVEPHAHDPRHWAQRHYVLYFASEAEWETWRMRTRL